MERLDTYFREHQKTGRIVNRNNYKGEIPNEYLMVVHLCVFNTKGEMLIQKRQLHKDRYPGMWDISAGGFAQSGETANDAVLREADEELGMKVDSGSVRYIMSVPFSYVLDEFFSVQGDYKIDDFTPQQEEVLELKWATLEEVLELCKEGQFVDYDVNLLSYCFSSMQTNPG